jgi:hypothetical protein
MSRFITYTNTLALFGLNVMLCYEQSKSTKHWDNCLSHCMCLSDTTSQIVWIESLFKELNFDISNIALCGDNQGAIFLASNPAQEHRSKHIDI